MNALSLISSATPWTSLDLANHLWQSTIVGLGILSLILIFRPVSARTRRAMAWMALAKFALPGAMLTRWLSLVVGAPDGWLEPRTLTLPPALSPTMFLSPTTSEASLSPVEIGAASLWLLGFIALFSSWLIRGALSQRRILTRAVPVSPLVEQQVAAAADQVSLKTPPRCYSVAGDRGPGALGLFSPVVILPLGLEETLAPAEFQAVLIHEFVHLQRRDNLWSAAQTFLVSLFWFHPLVWMLNRQLGIEAEKSCDERVVEITRDAPSYASGIVKCVRHNLGLSEPSLVGVSTPPVLDRVKTILTPGPKKERPLARGAALATGLLAITLSGHAGTFGQTSLVATSQRADLATSESVSTPPPPSHSGAAEEPAAAISPFPTAITPSATVAAPPTPAAVAPRELESVAPVVPAAFYVAPSTPTPTAQTPAPSVSLAKPVTDDLPADRVPPAAVSKSVDARPASEPTVKLKSLLSEPPQAAAPPAPPAANGVYDVNALDRPPVPVSQKKPRYPLAFRRPGGGGNATIDFIVDIQGNVVNARAISFTHREFAAAAEECVSQWKFKPGQKNRVAVNTHLQVPIIFTVTP